ncbi:hypothetical protein LNP25_01220 [Klebsiella variicola subsp. variicola]|nr:hypothetical protein [Klebsiella variicola subsp. variicola]
MTRWRSSRSIGKPTKTGGHAFALVGFNRDGFIVQNSWGTEWGCGGFAVLSYADWLTNAMDAWWRRWACLAWCQAACNGFASPCHTGRRR